jgi:hypothetical protein
MEINIKPIETEYNGYRFRSRLEARWAVFFDTLGIQYEYEPEGFQLSDGTLYLPDFYLPQSKAFFEVKGVMSEADEHKVTQMIKDSNHEVIVGYDGLRFVACDEFGIEDTEYCLADGGESRLCRCRKCGNYFFMGMSGSWNCRVCGYYDGNAGFDEVMRDENGSTEWCSHDSKVEMAIKAFKQARFEHGETPNR